MKVDKAVKKPGIRYPESERKEIFDCSCYPPNLMRFLASLGGFIATATEDTIFMHHYMESSCLGEGFRVSQMTGYPASGRIKINISGRYRRIALRIPGWADEWSIDRRCTEKSGYAFVDCKENDEICLELSMEPKWMEAAPPVAEDCGKLALMRGPVVYCMEEEDNGANLRDIRVNPRNQVQVRFLPDAPYAPPVLEVGGSRRWWGQDGLYRKYQDRREEILSRWVSYHTHSNRSAGEMTAWADYE